MGMAGAYEQTSNLGGGTRARAAVDEENMQVTGYVRLGKGQTLTPRKLNFN